ncbi:hypothetical protein HK096_003558 [Nowakowskiella sp. JEL0078]|nr:hypothetical protein HK096_003558 [Nowakowskiella sp. JEL0078]
MVGNGFPKTALFIAIGIGAALVLMGVCTGVWCAMNKSRTKKEQDEYKEYLDHNKPAVEEEKPKKNVEPLSELSGQAGYGMPKNPNPYPPSGGYGNQMPQQPRPTFGGQQQSMYGAPPPGQMSPYGGRR